MSSVCTSLNIKSILTVQCNQSTTHPTYHIPLLHAVWWKMELYQRKSNAPPWVSEKNGPTIYKVDDGNEDETLTDDSASSVTTDSVQPGLRGGSQ